MDEVFFRIARLFESLQIQLILTSERCKVLILHCSDITYQQFLAFWNSEFTTNLKFHCKEIWMNTLDLLKQFNITINDILQSPLESVLNIVQQIKNRSLTIDRNSLILGAILGFIIGFIIGLKLQNKSITEKCMKAVICNSYDGVDRVVFVDDIITPTITSNDDVLIQVKSAAIDKVDIQICSGYGIYIRKCLSQYYSNKSSIFPIILGRSCSGIVTDIGCRVTKVEVGDEVWAAIPPWCPGTISDVVLAKECFVGKKPSKISFEGAASLSYSGCIALQALENANLNATSALNKKILIESCCTPIGCILTQILKHWGASITTSCLPRAAPVAKAMGSIDNIINIPTNHITNEDIKIEEKTLIKELEQRDVLFDVIFITNNNSINRKQLLKFLNKKNGIIISTLPQSYITDHCNFIFSFIVCLGLRIQFFLQRLFSFQHLEEKWLDILYHFVENDQLQSVVDHIYPPQNIELAIAHKMSSDAIGNTVLKFT